MDLASKSILLRTNMGKLLRTIMGLGLLATLLEGCVEYIHSSDLGLSPVLFLAIVGAFGGICLSVGYTVGAKSATIQQLEKELDK